MSDCMTFPKTADDFIEQYSFKDIKQEYTNGAELIPVFRVKQMLEHYYPAKNGKSGRLVHDGQRIRNGVDWWRCGVCGKPVTGVEVEQNSCSNCGAIWTEKEDV